MGLERAQLALLAVLAATIPLSIFAAEASFALGVLVLAARLATGRARLSRTPLDAPLAAFAVWTLLAASFAREPAVSHEDSKKLLLFALFYLAVEVLGRAGDRERVLSAALLGGVALAGLVVMQGLFLGYDRLNHRPPGFLGHYMSASGVTLGVLLLASARLVLGPRPAPRLRGFALPALVLAGVVVVAVATQAGAPVAATRVFVLAATVLAAAVALWRHPAAGDAQAALPFVAAPLATWALVLSQTRSAWIGAVVGLAVVATLRSPRLLWVAPAAAAAILALRPAAVTSRLTVADDSSRDRYYMWQAGIDMVLDRPVFGQGPGMILSAYPRYRWPEATHPVQPHLHNNLLQIAAERGVPALAFFLWWALAAFLAALREARRAAPGSQGWAAGAACAVLAAVFAAGLFEYNLGDSEVLMLVLLLTAVPFALQPARPAAA